MPRLEILSAVEREEFDAPPTFTLAQQQRYFEPSLSIFTETGEKSHKTRKLQYLQWLNE